MDVRPVIDIQGGSAGATSKCLTALFSRRPQHMCSLESEFESQMGEFHVKMKGRRRDSSAFSRLRSARFSLISVLPSSFSGLAGFARLCAGDQYEVGNAR